MRKKCRKKNVVNIETPKKKHRSHSRDSTGPKNIDMHVIRTQYMLINVTSIHA